MSKIDPNKLKFVFNPDLDEADTAAAYYDNKKLKELELDESEPKIVSVEMYLDKNKVTAETIAFEAEQERLRKQITYTIKITEVKNQLSAMFALRKALDWDAGDIRSKLASLPCAILETTSTQKAKSMYEQLADTGLTLRVSAVNGLGEKVKPDFVK